MTAGSPEQISGRGEALRRIAGEVSGRMDLDTILADVIEASTDLVAWGPVSTNVMDFSLCPICPYFIFEDPASTNLPRRFYRAFELW